MLKTQDLVVPVTGDYLFDSEVTSVDVPYDGLGNSSPLYVWVGLDRLPE